ncbi:MAG TPA: N-6 DNA methylase [Anaerolineae bacterium]
MMMAEQAFLADYEGLFLDLQATLDHSASEGVTTADLAANLLRRILVRYFLRERGGPDDASTGLPGSDQAWLQIDPVLNPEIVRPICETFDRYNFTLREATPRGNALALTPEILGKIFEHQLAEDKRKARGAFYTPRELVHSMVRASLVNTLLAKSVQGTIPRRDLEALFRPQAETQDDSYPSTYARLPKSIRGQAQVLDEALASIKICDPAVGSGAFPVAVLYEIVRGRTALGRGLLPDKNRTPFDFKHHAIEHSIYGVDIDPAAVEIARLRLWLALIADDTNGKLDIPPNDLARNLVCDNALFTDFFDQTGGFDIVIGNPPYVRVDDVAPELKQDLKKEYHSARGKYDLYYLFLEKALQITTDDGQCVFITPNKYCAATSAKNLRALILKTTHFGEIISTSKLDLFNGRGNYPVISIFGKSKHRQGLTIRTAHNVRQLSESVPGDQYTVSRSAQRLLPDQVIPINANQAGLNLALRLLAAGVGLGHYLAFSEGLRIPKRLERATLSDHRIVKQYQFRRYGQIKSGHYLSDRGLNLVSKPTTRRYQTIFSPKILIAEDALRIRATVDFDNRVPQGGVYFATNDRPPGQLLFLLGLLNSNLFSYVYELLFGAMHMGGGYLRYRSSFLAKLPLPEQAMNRSAVQRPIISLTEQIVNLTQAVESGPIAPTAIELKRCERQLDQLVYELYQLSPAEITLVENNVVRLNGEHSE